jgi:hypothetical protein
MHQRFRHAVSKGWYMAEVGQWFGTANMNWSDYEFGNHFFPSPYTHYQCGYERRTCPLRTYIPRVPPTVSVPSSELGPPTPSPASEYVRPLNQKGGGDTLACGWGGGGGLIRTTGEKAYSTLSTLCARILLLYRISTQSSLHPSN